ncbi:unnamed protein product [Vitrella brassicaformis CCMP3155]|uniref:Phospholipase A2 domain-containing protein n=1 Tax=Vitrella brassicaformis (strain CCMP3155) TaxID=1169540 RepID=A0A0G4FWF7_VITBC|nr:unnamed protein product [Vitrella brassicaformis CCMP3155]|mmetsp:Transcript_10377/g.25105  ORF Transcript_10377/g.25105 Transcript_10377/m.25105 type:complete len:149 (-) Transcript_10377:297-743(-)|eukprot:CEM19548.1 unnamed protein product [Vitrella brassicaformis CCMP3155]
MSTGSHTAVILLLLAGLSVASPTGKDTTIRRLDACDDLLAPCSSPYAQAPDGCSGVPNKYGSVDFTEVCNEHDRCYYTLGSNADDCNNDFRDALIRECQTSATSRFLLRACKLIANKYYIGVAATADFFHTRAQQRQKIHEHCCFCCA